MQSEQQMGRDGLSWGGLSWDKTEFAALSVGCNGAEHGAFPTYSRPQPLQAFRPGPFQQSLPGPAFVQREAGCSLSTLSHIGFKGWSSSPGCMGVQAPPLDSAAPGAGTASLWDGPTHLSTQGSGGREECLQHGQAGASKVVRFFVQIINAGIFICLLVAET